MLTDHFITTFILIKMTSHSLLPRSRFLVRKPITVTLFRLAVAVLFICSFQQISAQDKILDFRLGELGLKSTVEEVRENYEEITELKKSADGTYLELLVKDCHPFERILAKFYKGKIHYIAFFYSTDVISSPLAVERLLQKMRGVQGNEEMTNAEGGAKIYVWTNSDRINSGVEENHAFLKIIDGSNSISLKGRTAIELINLTVKTEIDLDSDLGF